MDFTGGHLHTKSVILIRYDSDVKALLRTAVVWNVPIACNRASSDFMFSSPLMSIPYERMSADYEKYRERRLIENE
jgi:methylglyoxal synthase